MAGDRKEKNVLISFLGTGDRKGNYVDYYYEIEGNRQDTKNALIFKALYKHYKDKYGKIDNIILLGTLTSMWQNVYISFDGDNDDTDNALKDLIDDENYLSPITSKPQCIEEVQKVVSSQTKSQVNIELLNYGCNKKQIRENAQIIMGLDKYFKEPNMQYNLIVDVTHGFRSLPLYVMNLLIYLQNVKANIDIKHITYGMSELTRDYKWKKDKGDEICPVVDLNDPEFGIMALNKWINGAYAFKEFGKGYQIAEMLKEDNVNNDTVNKIKDFSDVMNLNSMANIDTKTEALLSIRSKDINPFANQVLKPVISQFSTKNTEGKDINKFKGNNSKALLDLTVWHFKHKNFASSFLTILECMISYVCEKCDFSIYILPKDKYLSTKRDKIDRQWDTVQHIKNSKSMPVYANKDEYVDELYDEYVNNQKDKCAKQVLGNEEINIIKVDYLDFYAKQIENYNDISLVYKSVNLIRNSIAHVNKYDSKSLIYKLTQLQEKLSGVSFTETNLIEIKILDASIKVLKKHMKF